MVQVQTFGYDAAGNLASATDPDGSYTVTYDALDQPVEVVGPSGLTLDFSYDAGGDRTSAWDSAFGTETSEYDALGRLTSRKLLTADGQVWVDYTYTALDQVATVTRYADLAGTVPAGTTAYTYDDAGHLTAIQTRGGSGGLLADYSYTYDDAGRPASKTEGGVTTAFGYDDAGQVTADGSAAFSYDGAGNRTNTGYQTGDGNRLESDGTWAYTYDAAGELVKKSQGADAETWTYGYDHRGQMVWAEQRATDGGTLLTRVEYAYDAFGNRIRRVQYDGSLAVVSDERYALDGWDTARPGAVGTENFDAVADLDAAGNVTARRVFGPGFDEPVARLDPSGAVAWYGTDSQGSVRQVFDNAGTVAGSRDYTAFGAITLETGAGLDRYGYTGREWDAALGLQYSRARMYDPAAGRWTSEDPLGLAADVNPFRYVGNAVTLSTDPSGLQPPDRGSWWNRFGNQVRHRATEAFDKFSNGLEQLSNPAGVAERFGNGAVEFGRRAETFGEKFVNGANSLGTAEGWQRAADIYSGGASWWADQIANNSAEYTADAILTYLAFRSPAVAADAAGAAAAYGTKLCPRKAGAPKYVPDSMLEELGRGYGLAQEEFNRPGYTPDPALENLGRGYGLAQEPSSTSATPNIPRSLLDNIVDEANRVASPGGAVTDAQRTILRQNLPEVQRRNAAANQQLRREFVSREADLVAEWETQTGRTWPAGATPHHIIPLESGGANAWWNLMPTHGSLPNHSLPGIPGPHAAGGVLRQTIQQGRRALPPGTTTDLRRPQ